MEIEKISCVRRSTMAVEIFPKLVEIIIVKYFYSHRGEERIRGHCEATPKLLKTLKI